MDEPRFRIIFEKLAETAAEEREGDGASMSDELRAEIDEIAELRRLVLETTEPDQKSYTTT
jgi:hypothetical protein